MILVKNVEKIREYYKEKSILGITWEEIERADSIGRELRIAATENPEKVFINGIEYKQSN